MSGFQPAWYVRRELEDGTREVAFFSTPQRVMATGRLFQNGDLQLVFLPRREIPWLDDTWSPKLARVPVRSDQKAGSVWDQLITAVDARTKLPGDHSRNRRIKQTLREMSQCLANASPDEWDGLTCSREIHVGIFFDGTNNNMYRDRPQLGHSNIASLYDAHREDKVQHFRYYVPGVGTPFPQIGETSEDSLGRSMARGGENRIHWALVQLYNAVHASVVGFDLLTPDETKKLVTTFGGLRTLWRLGDDKMVRIFRELDERLVKQLKERRPHVARLHLSVFGFSRGAAEARTFCNWVKKATKGKVGPATLNLRFLGIFDTVASVLLADSAPVGSGFFDWADGTMGVEGVGSTVHYVAAHEIRRSFPLSTLRAGGGWPDKAKEFVYPGAHSDLGGGYSPGDQGKSTNGRTSLLSQIPLNDMYWEAFNAGVKLKPLEELQEQIRNDFKVHSDLDRTFSAYLKWTPADERGENLSGSQRGVVEDRMRDQMQRYWRWRATKSTQTAFRAMSSWRNASAQDRIDLEEGEKDWRRDIELARTALKPVRSYTHGAGTQEIIYATPTQRDLIAAVDNKEPIPAEADRLFDAYVHDSHAGFYLLGPLTKADKELFLNEVRKKEQVRQALLATAERAKTYQRSDVVQSLKSQAAAYELNSFERRVLDANPGQGPVTIPIMTDADAADLRGHAATEGFVVKHVLGSGTRREARGHGQYRRVFDKS